MKKLIKKRTLLGANKSAFTRMGDSQLILVPFLSHTIRQRALGQNTYIDNPEHRFRPEISSTTPKAYYLTDVSEARNPNEILLVVSEKAANF